MPTIFEQNKEQEVKDSAAQETISQQEAKNKRKPQQQIIREFLESLGPYEADAIRVVITASSKPSGIDSLTPDDKGHINRYLNCGLKKEDAQGNRILMYRHKRALDLSEKITRYIDKSQLPSAYNTLTMLAINDADVNAARTGL